MAENPIASGFLNGFGGFMAKKFRMHDFQLGRRNCQQFLRKYFALPVKEAKQNAVFKNYSEADFDQYSFQKNGTAYIPIIPLLGEARQETFPLHWDTLKMNDTELNAIREQVYDRTKIIINRIIDQYIQKKITRIVAKGIAKIKRDDIADKIMKTIQNQLNEFGLHSDH